MRCLQDLPLQGARVTAQLKVARLKCRNRCCDRQIFAEPQLGATEPRLRQTRRLSDGALLLGHGAGGRPAERILARLGMPVSDDTVLRCLRRRAAQNNGTPVRVVGIDGLVLAQRPDLRNHHGRPGATGGRSTAKVDW